MSWQLLVPVVEQIVKAGIDYMNADSVAQGAVAPATESEVDPGSVVLLTLKGDADNLKDKVRQAVNTIEGVEVVVLEVTHKPIGSNDNA